MRVVFFDRNFSKKFHFFVSFHKCLITNGAPLKS